MVRSCTSHPGVLGSIPTGKREEPGKTCTHCVKVPGFSRVDPQGPAVINTHTISHLANTHPARTVLDDTHRGYASFSDICGARFGSGFGIGFTLLRARSFTRSPSARHPPFTQYPFSPRSLVCGGQPSPHKPGLVVSHSTCPPLSSPHAHSFVIGPAVINLQIGIQKETQKPNRTIKTVVPGPNHGTQVLNLP